MRTTSNVNRTFQIDGAQCGLAETQMQSCVLGVTACNIGVYGDMLEVVRQKNKRGAERKDARQAT
ncbi:hypothetical protein C0Z18_01465 [Trinickia dabaoshanensis]|uniref:Uncharacterized protein n=1 Tax=Trinickia dabaoshanensis TaxID=564714 RepID=A0A2N7W396_9BURK|nr:hypothetical protein C0Z18_01465 [Trinickia dabaoshanensis]